MKDAIKIQILIAAVILLLGVYLGYNLKKCPTLDAPKYLPPDTVKVYIPQTPSEFSGSATMSNIEYKKKLYHYKPIIIDSAIIISDNLDSTKKDSTIKSPCDTNSILQNFSFDLNVHKIINNDTLDGKVSFPTLNYIFTVHKKPCENLIITQKEEIPVYIEKKNSISLSAGLTYSLFKDSNNNLNSAPSLSIGITYSYSIFSWK